MGSWCQRTRNHHLSSSHPVLHSPRADCTDGPSGGVRIQGRKRLKEMADIFTLSCLSPYAQCVIIIRSHINVQSSVCVKCKLEKVIIFSRQAVWYHGSLL